MAKKKKKAAARDAGAGRDYAVNDPKIDARKREIIASVATNLERIATAKGISRPALGHKAGLAQMNIYRAFRGRNEPALHTIVLLAEALGCSIDELVQSPAGKSSKAKGPKASKPSRTKKRTKAA